MALIPEKMTEKDIEEANERRKEWLNENADELVRRLVKSTEITRKIAVRLANNDLRPTLVIGKPGTGKNHVTTELYREFGYEIELVISPIEGLWFSPIIKKAIDNPDKKFAVVFDFDFIDSYMGDATSIARAIKIATERVYDDYRIKYENCEKSVRIPDNMLFICINTWSLDSAHMKRLIDTDAIIKGINSDTKKDMKYPFEIYNIDDGLSD